MYLQDLHTNSNNETQLSILPMQTIIARQADGNNSTVPESIVAKPQHTALPAWQIVLIVIGALIVISLLALLFLRIRTHYRMKRGASTTRFGGASFTGDHDGFTKQREMTAGGKRESVVGDAKVQIRKLIKKTRPSALSRGMEMTPNNGNADSKTGLSPFGFSTDTKRSSRKSHFSSRIKSVDMESGKASGEDGNGGRGGGPFRFSHTHTHSNSRSFIGTGSNPTSVGREEKVDYGFGKSPASNHGLGPGRGGRRSEDEWEYDDHSVAHTIRDSFDNDDDDHDLDTAVGTSAPVSAASPFTSPTRYGEVDAFSPSSIGHSYSSSYHHGLGRGLGSSSSPREQTDLADTRRFGHDRKMANRI